MEGDVSEREDEYHDTYIGDLEAQVEQDVAQGVCGEAP